jgi:membrane protein YqaA with SNARE-associated domain
VSESSIETPRRGLHRRLYDWVLHWAYTPYATPALVVLAFAESSFFPIPPDVMLLPLCLGDRRRALRFATWCSAASVLGGIAGYWMGYGLWNVGLRELMYDWVPGFGPPQFARVHDLYEEWNFWIVFTAGFSPLPYKVFTVTAGVFAVNFWMFVVASVISRSARFFLEALLLRRYGAPVREFIEKRLGLMALLFCILLVGGFVALKYLL